MCERNSWNMEWIFCPENIVTSGQSSDMVYYNIITIIDLLQQYVMTFNKNRLDDITLV
jgi:hypothetical protein